MVMTFFGVDPFWKKLCIRELRLWYRFLLADDGSLYGPTSGPSWGSLSFDVYGQPHIDLFSSLYFFFFLRGWSIDR